MVTRGKSRYQSNTDSLSNKGNRGDFSNERYSTVKFVRIQQVGPTG
jgi:hypothetical protein